MGKVTGDLLRLTGKSLTSSRELVSNIPRDVALGGVLFAWFQ